MPTSSSIPCPQSIAAVVERAIATRSPLLGRSAHAVAIKSLTPAIPPFISTHLINFYSKLDLPSPALRLLSLDPSPSVPSFTALISGLAQNSRPLLSLQTFLSMLRSPPLRPNDFTLPSVFKASASLRDPLIGSQIHSLSIKNGLITDVYVASAAEDMYFKSGRPRDARNVFDEMPHKNVVAWNAVMTNAVSDGAPGDAVAAFIGLMRDSSLSPNEVSYCALLNACVDGKFAWLGREAHSMLVRSGFHSNVSVGNGLIDFYGKCHWVRDARLAFDEMRRRDDVSWCSMIVIYAQNGMEEDAFKTYLRARGEEGLVPTDFMVSSILTTCSGLSGLDLGRAVHAVAVRSCIDRNIFVGSALVDM